LDAADVAIAMDSAQIADVVALVRQAGGALIGAYRDPLGGRPLVLASLPFNAVQPTPFQRDRSLEVIRMARSLAKRHATSKEAQYTAEFESADLLTLGI
jgi:hypothetical protein